MYCLNSFHDVLAMTFAAILFLRLRSERYEMRKASVAHSCTKNSIFYGLCVLACATTARGETVFGAPQRISVLADGTELNGGSAQVAISGNGRFIAFVSTARNLLPGVPAGPAQPSCTTPPVMAQVYVYDRQLRRFERVSENAAGEIQALPVRQPNNDCDLLGLTFRVDISLDGRYVSFVSRASNLVPSDTNFASDAYRFDRQLRRMERVTVGENGAQSSEESDYISADGAFQRYVIPCRGAYDRPEPLAGLRCIKDMRTGQVLPVKPYNGIENGVGAAFFSGDGRFLVYATKDPTLIPGGTLGPCIIYVDCYRLVRENLITSERVLISIKADGSFLDADKNSLAEVSYSGNSVAFPTQITEFYPPPAPSELVALAVWRDTANYAVDASVVDFGIGSTGIGYQGFSFDQTGTRLLWRQLDDFFVLPNSGGQQIVYRNLDEPQGHRIIRTLSGGLTLWGHCQKPRRPTSFLFNRSFNCPKLSLDGKTIVFSSQDATLVPGDSNFGLPINVDDERRQDVFIVSVSEFQPFLVPVLNIKALLALGFFLLLSGLYFASGERAR
jgi:hypothetical protein